MNVVPNGVDTERYQPTWDARRGRIAISLGEMARHKSWTVAAAAARAAGFEWRHVGPIRDLAYASEVEAAGGGAAKMLGSLSEGELATELARADVMLHPSVSENLPMAVIEGMSAGLPVIASDILGTLVREGENGYLLPTRADESTRVARATERLRALGSDAQLRRALGDTSRARALAEYSWASVAERVERVYRMAIA